MPDDSHGSIAASASERGADRGAESGQHTQPDDSHGSIAASASERGADRGAESAQHTQPDRVTARASVATATPERYAKQLASHLGRRCAVREEAAGTRLVLAGGECLLRPDDQTLHLEAAAADVPELDRVMHVVGSHLERFGQRNELTVEWQRP